jgi:4-hydroxy-tetrahydrodipicolinate synthase
MTLFRGLSAFPITPFDENGRVIAEDLRALLRRLTGPEVGSIGLLGSTGAYPYLTRGERRRAIEIAVDEVGGRAPLMFGIGALRTDEAVALGQDAKAAGADAVLLAPVSYTPLTEDEAFVHYETVAGSVGLPLCIYNNPGATRFDFSAGLVGRLSRLPHIVALKNPASGADTAAEDLRRLREVAAADFSVGYSMDWKAAEAMIAGADAWYSVLGGIFPGLCAPIMSAAEAGDARKVRDLAQRLARLFDLFVEASSVRVVYAIVNQLGLSNAQPPRPMLPVSQDVARRVGEALETLRLV